jgi:two-component system cell cycle sensor histidine kinase/response regulator CckA
MAKPTKKKAASPQKRQPPASGDQGTFFGLAEAIPDSILIRSGNKIVYVNPACMKLLAARSPGQLLGKDLAEIVHPDHLAATRRRVEKVAEYGKASPPTETVWIALNGERVELEATTIPMRWRGSPAVAKILRDIREKKQAQREIQAWNKRLELAQKAGLRIGLWEWDLVSDRLMWSEEVYRQFGYTRENFRGKGEDLRRRIHPEDVDRMEEATRRVIAGGSDFDMQFRVLRPDGSVAWVESHGVMIRNGGTRMIGVSIDITEVKNLEQQFLQAQKLEAVGRLAGGVAHDFNNVLMSISSYAEMLVHGSFDEKKIIKYATRIYEAAMQAASVTRQLLAFSHKQKLEPELLDLDAVIVDLATMMPKMLGEDVVLTTHLGTPLGRVKLDRGQIEQVIMNLAVNARDAMPRGGKLTITTRRVDLDEALASEHAGATPGSYLLLSVSDTGSGMDANTKARIFEPFFTTKERGKGTGLGLATVYGIVKQSGGFVRVYSDLGRGSRFDVYLPVSAETVSAAPAPKPDPDYSLAKGSETILLVEDDVGLRTVTGEFLQSIGYAVLEANSSTEALRQCETHASDINLMITDVIMPGLDGVELARAIRIMHPQIRILLMSGYNEGPSTDFGLRSAMMMKPFSLYELAGKLRELLDRPALDSHDIDSRAAG